MPLTSIIMPSYRSDRHICAAVDSLKGQTDPAWELIISDDGSPPAAQRQLDFVASSDPRIRILKSNVNEGAARARNRAIEAATGRYIAFLDSDDLWKPQKLERQIEFMKTRDIAFSFTAYDRIDEAGTFLNTHPAKKPVSYHDLLKSCVIGCLTAAYDTDKLGKVYMPERRGAEDFGLWLRILKKVDFAHPISESLAQYRVRSDSVSSKKLHAAGYTWSIYRNEEKLGFIRSIYYFTHYTANGLLNTYVKPRNKTI